MDIVLEGFKASLAPDVFVFILLGVLVGIVIGALPGLDATSGVALLLPITYVLTPVQALVFFASLYAASEYGCAITAILFRVPGTSEALMTAIEGYEFTKRGEAGMALGIALSSSVIGGLIACIALFTIAPFLASVALQFGPAEYFALGILGLSCVTTVSGNDQIKGLMAALIGLFIGLVGLDSLTSARRFDFGFTSLLTGIPLVPAFIGLFAGSEVLRRIALHDFELVKPVEGGEGRVRMRFPKFAEIMRLKWTILRGTIIGLWIGILPAVGATTAAIVGYGAEVRFSKNPEEFGKGKAEGIAAPEAANNAAAVGAMIPLITLGIPGSGTTAVLIGAFMIHNLKPGALLFVQEPLLVYTLFSGMTVSHFVILVLAFFLVRIFVRLTFLPYPVLAAAILSVSLIGSMSFGDVNAVILMLAFAGLGLLLEAFEYPLAPLVMGMVLSPIVEISLRRALIMSYYNIWDVISEPIAAVILVVSLAIFVWPWVAAARQQLRQTRV